jgi:RNA polymerase sigma-70 factor, ECF subfamily
MEYEFASGQVNDLYHQYADDIYRFILLIARDQHKAEDLMHDTFLKAFKNMEQFSHYSNQRAWLFVIARNLTIDYIRRNKPIKWAVDIFPLSIPSPEKLPDEKIEADENLKTIYDALGKIKEKYRFVIVCRIIEGFSTHETAEILGWSQSKVKVTLHRGLIKLRKQLEKEGFTYEPVQQ